MATDRELRVCRLSHEASYSQHERVSYCSVLVCLNYQTLVMLEYDATQSCES